LLAALAATLLASTLTTLLLLFVLAVVLALASQISLSRLYRQAWLSVLLFSGLLALPAIFMVPGERCSPCRCCTGTSPGRGSPVRPFCWAGPKSRPAMPCC
jgi:hypothetical protein